MGLFDLFKKRDSDVESVTPEIPSDPEGQYQLGFRYASGRGVPKDLVMACKWLSIAAANGHGEARELKDMLSERMTPTQVADAEKRATAFVPHRELAY